MVYRAILFLALTAAPAVADQIELSNSLRPAETDRYGCAIRPRPEHLTLSSFRDSWRSVAADKLYSLRRYQLVLGTGSCDCAVLQPEWSIIEDEYQGLGFADGPSSTYDDWADTAYFPMISGLRNAVRDLCEEAE
ncbi:hypothetical protein HCZ23_14755 [Celeribacter sp. HF31]|uniref:hypothetical protein n=1 Tax=Celeribacter sp. HF31 TaxID=2721558 RepID=UPI00143213E4|nr:hypothetical protein [Celeribacter sp. HF31]NIY80723.1 hypothetical protein [Celeribacter sp. HF31]